MRREVELPNQIGQSMYLKFETCTKNVLSVNEADEIGTCG